MIKVKNWMDAVQEDDGSRLWIEPMGLTKDLRAWCEVDHILPHLGPPMKIWQWFEEHPDGYEYFRATYHDALRASKYRPALEKIAADSAKENFTLLYQSDDDAHNTATALHEFISELSSYCRPSE